MKNHEEITQEQHERLCAFLFEELGSDERAAFEVELAASPALQAERVRLEASMALVREFAPAAPTSLSDSGRAALSDAAQAAAGGASSADAAGAAPGPRLAWYRHPGLQVAAAAIVAVVAFRSLDERLLEDGFGVRPDHASSDRIASAETAWRKAAGPSGARGRGLAATADEPQLGVTQMGVSSGEPSSTLASVEESKDRAVEAERRAESKGGLEVRHETSSPGGQLPIQVVPTTAQPTGGYNANPNGPETVSMDLGEAADKAGAPSVGFFYEAGQDGDFKASTSSMLGATLDARLKDLGYLSADTPAELFALGHTGAPAVDARRPGGGGGIAPMTKAAVENGASDMFLGYGGGAPAPGKGIGGVVNGPGTSAPAVGLVTAPQSPGAPAPADAPMLANAIYEVVGPINGGVSGGQYYLGTTDEAVDDGTRLKQKLVRYAELSADPDLTVDELLVRARALDAYDPASQPEAYLRARAEELYEEVDALRMQLGDEGALADGEVVRAAVATRVQELEDQGVLDHLTVTVDGDDAESAEEAELAEQPELVTELSLLQGYLDDVELVADLERKRVQRRRVEVEQEYERIITRCLPRQAEKPSMMYFRYWGDNGYEFPVHDALSTFAVDVDTASYTLARRYLQDGYLPERAQIRTEEFVNYFTPDLAAPTDGEVFAVSMELAPSPFGPGASDGTGGGDHKLLRVGLRGMEVDKNERDPLALTFVVDVSGSMKEQNRLELVKHSLRLLMAELHPSDQVAIVTFNNDSRRVLDMTSAGNTAAVETALYAMHADGGTNAEAGLRLGYEEAVLSHTPGAINRVVFLSDGVGNIGETNENTLLEDVRRAREKGIYLNTIGVGMGNHNDRFLEQLANGGDGLCNYIDGPEEAYRALVENFTGAFQPIARDVKLQVEFDKAQVASYRLLGYENRAIADADFRNDKVDAGEVGAGHQVVALYEIVLLGSPSASDEPMAVARVRYKQPYGELEAGAEDSALELEHGFWLSEQQGTFEGATIGFQKSALAAQFAEFLRRSSHARDDSVSLLRYKLEELARLTGDPELVELSALVQLAQPKLEPALLAARQQKSPLQEAADELHAFEYDNLRRVYTGASLDAGITDQLEDQRLALKQRLRTELYLANGIDAADELPGLIRDSMPR